MRARIDISEIEAETKIRAKYLRALENEEFELLPGPTYVKSFLRTYAEALGLDAKLLVEEYKVRYERVPQEELHRPIVPSGARPGRDGGRGPLAFFGLDGPPPRWLAITGLVVVVLVGVGILGSLNGGGGGDDKTGAAPTTTPSTTTASKAPRRPRAKKKPTPTYSTLSLQATAQLYVCLRASGNRTLVPGRTLQPNQKVGPFHARSFKMLLGNNSAKLRLNGKTVKLAGSSSAIALRLSRKSRATLTGSAVPTCQ